MTDFSLVSAPAGASRERHPVLREASGPVRALPEASKAPEFQQAAWSASELQQASEAGALRSACCNMRPVRPPLIDCKLNSLFFSSQLPFHVYIPLTQRDHIAFMTFNSRLYELGGMF